MLQAVSRLGLPPWKPGFDPRQVHMRFVVDKMALRQFFLLRVPRFFPVSVIPPALHSVISHGTV